MADVILRPWQEPIVEHLLEHERCAAWCPMGSGKSLATLVALDHLYAIGAETMPTLILAPLRVARSTWPDEAEKWGFDKVVPITGTASQRAMLLRQDVPYMSINYEQLPWLVSWYKNNPKPWPFGTVVADESTKLKNTRISDKESKKGTEFEVRAGGTVRARSLTEVSFKKVHRFIELTGTPSPNGLIDLWGQLWHVDRGRRLGRSFEAYKQRWFRLKFNRRGIEPMPHAQAEIQEILKDVCLTIDLKDWIDIAEPIKRTIFVDLPRKARQQYQKMEKEMFVQIAEHDIEAFNAAARTIKCHQLSNGAIYHDEDGSFAEVHDEKLQALDSIIAEASGMPVLVSYSFKSDLARLLRAFPKGKALDKNPQTIRDWNAGKIPVLFAHPASAGHGLNLAEGGNILVYFSVDWNLEEHMQILERIGPTRQKQGGFERPVFVYYILARDTVDTMIMERIESKREVQDILLEALKRKRII